MIWQVQQLWTGGDRRRQVETVVDSCGQVEAGGNRWRQVDTSCLASSNVSFIVYSEHCKLMVLRGVKSRWFHGCYRGAVALNLLTDPV